MLRLFAGRLQRSESCLQRSKSSRRRARCRRNTAGAFRETPLHTNYCKMRYDPAIHHRRSIRLQGYDYTQAGAYFVTICAQGRECLFGEIAGAGPCVCPGFRTCCSDAPSKMRLNAAGMMTQQIWQEMPEYYPGVALDAFVVMPNHIHGIVILAGQGQTSGQQHGQAQGPAPTLPDIVRQYKTLTMKRYADGVRQCGWRPFPGRLWQRNYWERVIRDEEELQAVREYIQNNPARWAEDQLNARWDDRGAGNGETRAGTA